MVDKMVVGNKYTYLKQEYVYECVYVDKEFSVGKQYGINEGFIISETQYQFYKDYVEIFEVGRYYLNGDGLVKVKCIHRTDEFAILIPIKIGYGYHNNFSLDKPIKFHGSHGTSGWKIIP